MTKYVCDFDSVRNAINILDNKIIKMRTDLKIYKQNISTELSGWESLSKSTFEEKNNNMIDSINGNIEHLEQISNYLKTVVSKLESVESSLASIKI